MSYQEVWEKSGKMKVEKSYHPERVTRDLSAFSYRQYAVFVSDRFYFVQFYNIAVDLADYLSVFRFGN